MTLKFLIKLNLLLILISIVSYGQENQNQNSKNILILCGLSPTQPAYRFILGGIRQKLTEQFGDQYLLHTEYLETENYPNDTYPKERFEIYNKKYRDMKLDLLICVGRNAIGVIKKNAENFFLNLPTLSIDLDFSNYGIKSDFKLNEQTAVVGMKFNLDKTLSTALSVFPNTTTVFFIGGTTNFDKFLMSLAKEASNKFEKDKKAFFITDASMDKILQQVRWLPANSIIFVPSFNTDQKHVTYHNPEAIRLISMNANAPVFAYSDMGLGDGAVGGYIMSFEKIGLKSGEFAIKILEGENPNSISVTEQDYYEYVFDWRQLKRWDLLDSELIPAGSKVLFKETDFFDKYKWIGGVVLLFIILQSILIAELLRLNRNKKRMTGQLIETQNKYKDFLHEDRSLRLGQLTASLSHELNQPLTAILSNAQAGINFINSNQATPELLKEILQKIVDNDKRGASILSSIRGMLKPESREKEKTNLKSLIEEVTAVLRSEAKKQDTRLFVQIFNEPVYVNADKIQIQQVIVNLIFNALQAMEKNETENKTIDIIQTSEDENVIISVRDYGAGIDESIKATIFKPFVTLKREGMGIGLAICRSIIEDHQGKIWAENMPDRGAKFSFSLKMITDE